MFRTKCFVTIENICPIHVLNVLEMIGAYVDKADVEKQPKILKFNYKNELYVIEFDAWNGICNVDLVVGDTARSLVGVKI